MRAVSSSQGKYSKSKTGGETTPPQKRTKLGKKKQFDQVVVIVYK
jgi:hypothetical protein